MLSCPQGGTWRWQGLHPNWGGETLRKALHVQIGSWKPTHHKYLLLTHRISYKFPPTLTNDPETMKGDQLIRSPGRLQRHPELCPDPSWELAWAHTESSLNQTLDGISRFWKASEACFHHMTSPRWEGATPQNGGGYTAPARLRPPPVLLPDLGSGGPCHCLHCSSGGGTFPVCLFLFKANRMLGLQSTLLEECLEGRCGTQAALALSQTVPRWVTSSTSAAATPAQSRQWGKRTTRDPCKLNKRPSQQQERGGPERLPSMSVQLQGEEETRRYWERGGDRYWGEKHPPQKRWGK